MNNLLRASIIVIFCASILAACGPLNGLMGPSSSIPSGSVLFQDDFSDGSSGWSVLNEPDKTINYDQGGFHFGIGQANYIYTSTPRLKFGDVQVSVSATKNSGPDDNAFGIICRYQDENNYYSLLMSSDGYYGISKMKAGEQHTIGADGMQFSQVIQTGNAVNQLRADCNGSSLVLWVNGEKLISTQDSDFATGDVGLVAGTFNQPGVDLTFDNFIVIKP
jgi:hypothetical protein